MDGAEISFGIQGSCGTESSMLFEDTASDFRIAPRAAHRNGFGQALDHDVGSALEDVAWLAARRAGSMSGLKGLVEASLAESLRTAWRFNAANKDLLADGAGQMVEGIGHFDGIVGWVGMDGRYQMDKTSLSPSDAFFGS